MAKRRERDSKRVPDIKLADPISHVKTFDPSETGYKANRRHEAKMSKSKLDYQGFTDTERKRFSDREAEENLESAGSGRGGGYYKISSAHDKPSEWHP